MSRGTLLQKQYVDFVKQLPTLGNEMSDLRRRICSLVIKSALLSSDGQNFSNFGETFEQNPQKCILRVERNTLTKTLLASWNKFHLWMKNFRICAGKFAGLLSFEHYLIPDGLIEYFCKNFYFSYFFGPPGNFLFFFGYADTFFWFWRWIILRMFIKTAFSSQEEHMH